MADKLLIVIVNTDPESGAALGSILTQAKVAAAMEFDVEVILSGQCDVLAIKGVAEQTLIQEGDTRVIYDLIKEAHAAGVRFKVCLSPLEKWDIEFISQVDETVNDAYLIREAMDDRTVTLTY